MRHPASTPSSREIHYGLTEKELQQAQEKRIEDGIISSTFLICGLDLLRRIALVSGVLGKRSKLFCSSVQKSLTMSRIGNPHTGRNHMKHNRNTLTLALTLAVGILTTTAKRAHAQGDIVSIDNPVVQSQKTPDYTVSGPKKKRWTQKEWVEIEVPFIVTKLPAKAVALSELVFKYYVVVNGPEKKLLTTTLNHTNVPGKEKVASVVYISPQTMQKISGRADASNPDKMIVAYGVEVEYEGKTVGFFDSTGKKKPEQAFWKTSNFPPADGLLAKKDTPFAPLWSDYHVEVR